MTRTVFTEPFLQSYSCLSPLPCVITVALFLQQTPVPSEQKVPGLVFFFQELETNKNIDQFKSPMWIILFNLKVIQAAFTDGEAEVWGT